jgi:ribosome biogenesis protein NSA2
MIREKRKEKAGKWDVPLPKVKPISEDEMFKVIKTGKRQSSYLISFLLNFFQFVVIPSLDLILCSTEKSWKRMVTKVTYVGEGFTRKPPKYERFIRPMALRFKKANVTHSELKTTLALDILGVKKNPQSPLYTQLGVITKVRSCGFKRPECFLNSKYRSLLL